MINRDDFFAQLDVILTEIGFVKNEDLYIRELKSQSPGQSMIINGQRFDKPGAIINVKQTVKFEGEGSVYNSEEDVVNFEMIKVSVYNNDELVMCSNNGFYYDESDKFKNYISQL